MNATTNKVKITNDGQPIVAFSSRQRKPLRHAMEGLALVFLAVALSEYTLAAEATAEAMREPITLAKAIEISLANNPELAVARYAVEEASDQRDIAAGARLPEIYLEGGYEFDRQAKLITPRRPGPGTTLPFTDQLLFGDFVVTMPLYTGGRLKNEVIRAELITQARWERLLRSRTELVFNVSSVFYSMLGQREIVNSLIFSQKTLEQHRKKTVDLLNAQKAARVDLLRTEVRLADIEQHLLRERNALHIQGYLLASLLGLSGEDHPLEVQGHLTLATAPVDLGHGLSTAFGNRQDYQSLKSEVLAQRTQVDIAKGERLPEVALRASYGNKWATDSSKHNEIGDIGMYFRAPLFEGGRISARIRQESNKLGSLQQRLRKLHLQIQLEVQTAASNTESTRARVGATQKAVEQAKESLRIEIEKYDQGKGAIVDVLDAQSALLDSQTNYYRALAEYNTALAQFRLAMGERQ